METIPHRELRNHSSEVPARVRRGESLAVTNHGELAAIISPAAARPLDRARQADAVREPRSRSVRFDRIRRAPLAVSSADVLADLRGDR